MANAHLAAGVGARDELFGLRVGKAHAEVNQHPKAFFVAQLSGLVLALVRKHRFHEPGSSTHAAQARAWAR